MSSDSASNSDFVMTRFSDTTTDFTCLYTVDPDTQEKCTPLVCAYGTNIDVTQFANYLALYNYRGTYIFQPNETHEDDEEERYTGSLMVVPMRLGPTSGSITQPTKWVPYEDECDPQERIDAFTELVTELDIPDHRWYVGTPEGHVQFVARRGGFLSEYEASNPNANLADYLVALNQHMREWKENQ